MSSEVTQVRYRPHDADYELDVELIEAAELRARVASNPERGFERVDFQCFLFVRSGSYSHTVDFETHRCAPGSCLSIGPGQVHRFGPPSDWDGWILIVGPHLVPDSVEQIPSHVRTSGELASAITELFARMTLDASLPADHTWLNELLGLEVRVLATRLVLAGAGSATGRLIDPTVLGRYREYRAEVDRHFRQWHLVAPYGRHLGCSTKSLDRACQAASAVTAKRVIVERIVLEAKRLLALGNDTAARISADLGFDEPTNFAKYFQRETGTTPAAFRATTRTP